MALIWGTIVIFVFAHFVECHKECGEPEDYPEMQLGDGYRSKSVFDNGQNVEYKCAPGYTLTGGSPKSHCKEGHWSPLKMKCRKIKCEPLSAIQHGRCIAEGDSYGDKAVVECDEGYVLRGNRVRVCKKTGWSGSSPTCEVVKCPAIFVANGQVAPQAVVFNTVVQITCAPGFKLNGERQLRCGAGGSWIPKIPTCEPVKCPVISVANGLVAPQVVLFNTAVRIFCSHGFILNGAQLIRCGPDGSWTPNIPTCEPVYQSPVSMTCSAPVVENGVIKGGARPLYKPNDTVIIICKAGCHMIGVSEAKCGPDGQWQGLPHCHFSTNVKEILT